MKVQRNFLLLTLVLFIQASIFISTQKSHAAPTLDAPIDHREEVSNTQPSNTDNLSNTAITEPPKVDAEEFDESMRKFDRRTYYYPYQKTVSVHGGVVFGIQDSSDDKDKMNGLIGFSYLLPKRFSPQYELQTDLSFVGHGHLSAMKRFIFNEKNAFRPYYRYGVTHKFVPDEKAASFSNWDNYLIRGSMGFEDIRKPPRSIRMSLDAAVGAKDILVLFTAGYSWGW